MPSVQPCSMRHHVYYPMNNANSTRRVIEASTPNLNDILGSLEDQDCETHSLTISPYFCINDTTDIPLKGGDKFNILSINIQSLNAKFDALVAFLSILQNSSIHFHAICLQETWQGNIDDCQSKFSIPGYNLISKSKTCSEHGGLAIYLDTSFSFTRVDYDCKSSIWEGLFIEVNSPCLEKKLTLGTIYRPPKFNNCNSTIDQFIYEIRPIIVNLSKKKNITVLSGDMNIDLLQINERKKIPGIFRYLCDKQLFAKNNVANPAI